MAITMRGVPLVLVLGLCAAPRAAVADDAVAKLFRARCATCHGAAGDGNTASGRKLGVKNWRAARILPRLSDGEIARIVREGVKGKGGKWAMAPFPKLSDEQIASLTAHMRALAK